MTKDQTPRRTDVADLVTGAASVADSLVALDRTLGVSSQN